MCTGVKTAGGPSSRGSSSEDASRATSVPRPPIAMPMCAAFSDGASLTPPPVIATPSPRAFSGSKGSRSLASTANSTRS